MKILNFGSCNIDYVYSVEHFVRPGETLSATNLNIFPGGKGLNQSIAVARAGGKIYHAGCIGNDGEFLRELLNNSGVDTTFLKTVEEKTGHAVIEVTPDGENRIVVFAGANYSITEDYVDFVLSHFESGDILLLQNEISHRRYILKKAKEKNMTVVFNIAPFDVKIGTEDLSAVKYLAVNKTEASGLTGKTELSDIIDALKEKYKNTNFILTLGKKGCVYFNDKTQVKQSAFSVDAVDTTAAGDTFIGYFVAGIAQNGEMGKILKLSCCASALCVTKSGASSSIPELNSVKRAEKELKTVKYDDFASAVNGYISDNLENATLSGLAEKMNYSASYVARKFSASFNTTFSKYLQKVRCEKGKELLKESSLSVSEIGKICGYESDSHFRAMFKKITGMNPLEFRKKDSKIK